MYMISEHAGYVVFTCTAERSKIKGHKVNTPYSHKCSLGNWRQLVWILLPSTRSWRPTM